MPVYVLNHLECTVHIVLTILNAVLGTTNKQFLLRKGHEYYIILE